jgi:hypothetical protein
VIFDTCRITAVDALLVSGTSDMEFWYTKIDNSERMDGTVYRGTVALYDTEFEGEWAVGGGMGEVTENWHMNVSAFFRWNGEPAEGFEVRVYQERGSAGVAHSGTVDESGQLEMFWLPARRLTPQSEERLAPHFASIESGEYRATSPLPEDTWGDVVLEVRDVVGPAIQVEEPRNGTVQTNTDVTFRGTVLDSGSGLALMQYSHNGEIWEELEVENGTTWRFVLETVQGPNSVRIRGTDADGSMTVEEIWMTIDSYAPTALFVNPDPMTATEDSHIVLSGLVVLDEGTPIVSCSVDGVEVEVDGTGAFELEVELTEEGDNTFELLVVDQAGNVGMSSLTLVRDTTPPNLTVEPIGPYSRETYVILQGWIHDRLETVLTVNGRYSATLTEGPFSVNLSLAIGPNPIVIEATDALGNTARSEHFVVQDGLINGSIVSPVQGAVLKGRTVTIGVLTDPMAWVRVNGHTDWVRAANGSQDLEIVLEGEGEHTLEVVFRDDANNTLRSDVTITYVPPTEEQGWSTTLVAAVACAVVVAFGSLAVLAIRRRVRKPI